MCVDKMNDMPQLIVALNSNDNKAEYVYITNAKENETYYCPCCKGIVKPRAYKDDKDYMVQPHYYHINGGCSEESYVHYICKMFLTKNDCKFKVNDKEYKVKSVSIEKTYHTKFGDYRPDVTIETEEDKIFFAEIYYSNKKDTNYIPKWDELGNDVIEIDARYFVNLVMDNKVPDFKLIYSNGECFIKKYFHEDYERFIYDKKRNWQRQDILNYKIQWERLDWFFTKLQEYKLGNTEFEDMLDSFKQVDKNDKADLFNLIKKQSCLKGEKEHFRKIINDETIKYFDKKIEEYKNKGIKFYGNIETNKSFEIYAYVEFKPFNNFGKTFYCGNKSWIITIKEISEMFSNIDQWINTRVKDWEMIIRLSEDIKNKINNKQNCIWESSIEDGELFIGIKNYNLVYKDFGYKSFLRISFFNKLKLHYGYNSILDKDYSEENLMNLVIFGMNKVIDLVNKKDGIYRDYRYFIVPKEELNE